MYRYLVMVFALSVLAIGAVGFLAENPDVLQGAAHQPSTTARNIDSERLAVAAPLRPTVAPGVERLRLDRSGHHVAEIAINGHRVSGLIDTGATSMAFNETVARRAGIRLSRDAFVYPVTTANGMVMAARVTIDEVQLGSIRVHDIPAMVLDDQSLGIVLVGMSFLRQLREVSLEGDMLVLRR